MNVEAQQVVAIEDKIASLLRSLVDCLIDSPDDFVLTCEPIDGGFIFHMKAAPADTGKLIGKQGRTVRSMRTLLGAAAMRARVKLQINVLGFVEEV